jgi:hypothetical protein
VAAVLAKGHQREPVEREISSGIAGRDRHRTSALGVEYEQCAPGAGSEREPASHADSSLFACRLDATSPTSHCIRSRLSELPAGSAKRSSSGCRRRHGRRRGRAHPSACAGPASALCSDPLRPGPEAAPCVRIGECLPACCSTWSCRSRVRPLVESCRWSKDRDCNEIPHGEHRAGVQPMA